MCQQNKGIILAIKIDAYKTDGPEAIISPLNPSRDWMEDNIYSYNCFPLMLSNRLGWGISYPKDISFIWNDYDNDSGIEVLDGQEYCSFDRGKGFICFTTDIAFKTNQDISILTIPVPNQIINGATCLSSVMSYSFYTAGFQIVWKVNEKNKVISIPANTPVASIIPISLNSINNSNIIIKKEEQFNKIHNEDYMSKMNEYVINNDKFTNWYKNAVDQNGVSIGEHEVKSLKFNVLVEEDLLND